MGKCLQYVKYTVNVLSTERALMNQLYLRSIPIKIIKIRSDNGQKNTNVLNLYSHIKSIKNEFLHF